MFTLFTRARGALTVPLPLLGLVAAVGPLAMATGSAATTPGEPADKTEAAAYHSLPALPEGSSEQSEAGVVETAIELASTLKAVTTDEDGTLCDPDLLYVSWSAPGDGFEHGAHVTPVGPAPTADATKVNGVVLCEASDFAYMGFEARWSAADERWDVVAVPDISDEGHEQLVAQPAPVVPAGPKPVPVLAAPGTVDGPIEGYAAYEPQRTCDASPKIGTKSLAGALLRDYPTSRNLGIVRGCGVGGRSEHKEGRAFDWGVNIGNPTEKAAAEAFIGALMATDSDGNQHALARRMGVMYVIWDRQIWSSYRAAEGWRPYSGASAHRDHVHISLSWAGAEGRTSFWSGTVPPDLPTASPGRSSSSSNRSASASRSTTRRTQTAAAPTANGGGGEHRRRSGRGAWDAARALWADGTPPTAEELRATLIAHGMSAEDADDATARMLRGGDRSRDGDGDGDRAAREAARREEEQRRREAWAEQREAEEARRREERQEAEESWRQRREERAEAEEERREREAARREAAEEAWRQERERRRTAEQERRRPSTTTTTAPRPTSTTTTSTTVAPTTTTTTVAPTTTTTAAPEPATTTTTAGV